MRLLDGVTADAEVSPCGTYRYSLTRDWSLGAEPRVLWVMLNPSTASADYDDPTVRKCQKYAQRWGYGGIVVANLFALRSTDPHVLRRHPAPVGPNNDAMLERLLRAPEDDVGLVVAAWGQLGRLGNRYAAVVNLAADAGRDLHALKLTNQGQPGHPLYVPDATDPFVWRRA